MSTYINTNTAATIAANALSVNNDNESNDIQQLSTGLVINDAADDPAGLVVSEDNQAQLAGLNQATANTNDAINETQTADSALNQVQNLLISMRALAVQASNSGVNDSTDVQADQTQIASAIESINNIASTTQFGNKNLLDGSATAAMTTTPGTATANSGAAFTVVAQGSWSSDQNYDADTLSATTAATDTFTLGDVPGGTPTAATAANTTFSGSIAINGDTYNVGTTTAANLAGLNTAIASSGYTAAITGGNLVFTASADGSVTAPTIDASGLAVSGVTSSIASTGVDSTDTSTFATAAGTGGTLTAATTVNAATPITVSGTLALQDTNGISFNQDFAPGTSINAVQQALNSTFGTGANAVTVSSAGGDLIFTSADTTGTQTSTGSDLSAFNSITPPDSSSFVNGSAASMTLSNGAGNTITSTSAQTISGTSYYTFGNGLVLSTAVAPVTGATTSVTGDLATAAGTTTTGTDLQYQIGSNGGQTASLAIGSVAASQLGQGAASYVDANGVTQQVLTDSVADVNVSTFKGAQDAIAVIDQAIDQVSTDRANIGAFQTNVLQSNVTSLSSATTNLQAAESTVADADMATTVVNYTKDSILVQASTSALSYATQMPQEILKLLQ